MKMAIYQKASILRQGSAHVLTGLGNTKASHIELGQLFALLAPLHLGIRARHINSCRPKGPKSIANSIKIKSLITVIIILFFIHVSQILKAQSNPDSNYSADGDYSPGEKKIYREIDLENFETNLYTQKNIKIRFGYGTRASIALRSEFPAPIFGSTKFLAIKLFGEKANSISIFPVKPIIIENYCKKINIWAYGRGRSARLKIIIKDSRDNIHELNFGALKFRGWKKLSVKVPSRVNQADQYLNQKNRIQVIALVYYPNNKFGDYEWSFVYLDDLTAIVRKKYSDKEAINW